MLSGGEGAEGSGITASGTGTSSKDKKHISDGAPAVIEHYPAPE